MPEDLLEDVEGDPGVGEPGGAGVSEVVSGEVGQTEVSNNLVPATPAQDFLTFTQPTTTAHSGLADQADLVILAVYIAVALGLTLATRGRLGLSHPSGGRMRADRDPHPTRQPK